ncbi:MAG: TetR/AcrR family transcriptional regulator, partial [Bifidobacteriaceae bacterium]|nr:TetR/AcrR family transcriptional regulator [Bifidobacteriaceae bacterium]
MPHLYDIPAGYETRMRILKALSEMLRNQPLEAVTVSEICAQADLSRTSFYRHFVDKYGAVNWYNQLFDQRSLAQIGRSMTW